MVTTTIKAAAIVPVKFVHRPPSEQTQFSLFMQGFEYDGFLHALILILIFKIPVKRFDKRRNPSQPEAIMPHLFSVLFGLNLLGCDPAVDGSTTENATTENAATDAATAVASPEPAGTAPQRIITVPGNITETVFALGLGERVVGACASSMHPADVEAIPKVGYRSNLNAEGVLSLAPDLVIATDEAGPEDVMEQIRAAGVRVEMVPSDRTLDGAIGRTKRIAELLGASEAGERVVSAIRSGIASVPSADGDSPAKPRVMFIYVARKTSMVAGTGTAAEAMIALAGGINAVTDFEEFKPINPEAIVKANPDFILLDDSGLKSIGGIDGVIALPGVSQTVAGANRQVIAMDKTLLLGFGPRLADGALELARLLKR